MKKTSQLMAVLVFLAVVLLRSAWRRFKAHRLLHHAQQTVPPVRCGFAPVCYRESWNPQPAMKAGSSSPIEKEIFFKDSPPPWSRYDPAKRDHPPRLNSLSTTRAEPVSKSSAEIVVAAAESAQRKRSSTIGSFHSARRTRSSTISSERSSHTTSPTTSPNSLQKPQACHLMRTGSFVIPDVHGRRGGKSVAPHELGTSKTLPTVRIFEEDFDAITPTTPHPVTPNTPQSATPRMSHKSVPKLRSPREWEHLDLEEY